MLDQRVPRDDYAGGMGAGMARHALEMPGGLHQVADNGILLVRAAQLLILLHGLVQGHADTEGHQPGHLVDLAVGHAQGPAHVPQGGPGSQSPEGDDLGHMVLAVLLGYVGNNLVAAVVLEVQVDIRHLLALDVEEPLEDELVFQGIDVGDTEAVEDQAGRRAAADSAGYLLAPGKGDDVPHYQEVLGEVGLLDYFQLVSQPVFNLGARVVAVSLRQTLPAVLSQVLVSRLAGVYGHLGQMQAAELQFQVAEFSDPLGVLQRLWHVRELCGHLLGALEVEEVPGHLQPLLVVHRGVGLNAEHQVLPAGILFLDIMHIVGGHQRYVQLGTEGLQSLVDLFNLRNGVLLYLQVVVTEELLVPFGALLGILHAAFQH